MDETQRNNAGQIRKVDITEELSKNYLDYAMSVIVARALPDIRDGLKPVHRRILYAMHLLGLGSGPHSKSAKVVGEVLGKYHPHGDVAVYDAMVRMAQEFSMRYPLVDGQGNFGSVDGDPAAAMRYCITGSSLIVTDKGLEKIEDIKNRKNVKILSWNNAIKNAPKWFDSGIHPTLKIETFRGLSLQGSVNHPILTWATDEKGKPTLGWKMLGGIKVGEYAVINRVNSFFPEINPSLVEFHPNLKSKRIQKHILPKFMTPELAFILGSLIAEGNISKEQIGFCNTSHEFLNEFKRCFKKVFPDCRLHEYIRKPEGFTKKEYSSLEIHSKEVLEFLKNLGLKPVRAKDKKVPEIIYLASKLSIAAFLRGYAEGDGSVYLSGAPEICFTSMSKTLLDELQIILLRFSLESSVRHQPLKNIYKLFIRGHENLNTFAKEINFLSKRKTKKLSKVSLMNKDNWVMSKTDFIPFVSDYLRKSKKYYGKVEWLKKHNFDRLPKLKKIWPKLKNILDKEDRLIFEEILENNFLFDKITSVKKSSKEKVYSIGVDSPDHSFISNGFISHNTEVRLAKISAPLIADIEKETVDFTDNFDATLLEPSFLPALLPNLLLMGSEGIAVGMATKIPPHNLNEVVDGVIAAIKKGKNTVAPEEHLKEAEFYINKINLIAGNAKEKFTEEELRPKQVGFDSDITSAELVGNITGPDFPTGGAIYDAKSLVEVYETGHGRIVVRGIADIVEGNKGKTQIVISEIPYQVNKAILVEQIADLVKNKKIVGISGLRDESDKDGLRVVADLKRDAKPKSVLNNLYKHTRLQTTFSANFVALVDGTPYTVNLKQIIVEYIRHRQRVIIRRTIFELTGAKKRAHILEGLKIALDHLDEVIKIIRASKTQEDAKNNLIEKFKFSEIQATAILDMQLRRLAALERDKIEKEYAEMMKIIDHLTAILRGPEKVLEIIQEELGEIKEKFGDKRQTKIYKQKIGEITEEDLIAKEETLITITKTGYIKRLSSSSFKSQHRGGKGVVGMGTKEEDEIEHLLSATTHDMILFFTDKGRVFGTKAWDIVEGSRQSKGQALVNLINLEQGEEIKSMLPLDGTAKHLIMATSKGVIKKTAVSEFTNLRANGLIAIKLDKSDSLVSVHATSGDDFILMLTKNGKSIKFPEANVRSMGRATTGVRGMKLPDGDQLIGMEVFPQGKDSRHILTISNNGLGKITKVDLFPTQKRGGSGVKAVTINAKTGTLASAIMVTDNISQVIMTSKNGQVVKLALKDIPELGRATQGVILMRFAKKGDSVAAVTTLTKSGGEEE